jgi:NhaP-type Na+/H+ or K+/H+ antiporter
VLVISLAVSVPLGNDKSSAAQVLDTLLADLFGAFPLGLGLGILKYRLYDIDRLISRTLSYAVVTGLLIGVYVGIVVLTTNVLSFSSPVAVTASTLAAAALFTPIRNAAQRLVDRRFNRAGYDAEATVAAFSARLRDAVDLETVRLDLLAVVSHAVEPAHASIWISPARAARASSP